MVREGICERRRQRLSCKDCVRGRICEHGRRRSSCPTCDPLRHLAGVVRGRAYSALKNDKQMNSAEYLGCNIETFKQHIEQQFTDRMLWENYGEWHIDHKIPLKYSKSSLEDVAQRLHYTNTQPIWASENMSKGCWCISGWPHSTPDWSWKNIKIKKAWETVFQRSVKTGSLALKSLWKIKLPLKKER